MKQIRFPKAGGKIRLEPGSSFTFEDHKGLSIVIYNLLPPLTIDEKISGINRDRWISID
jgi:hypothetical protein